MERKQILHMSMNSSIFLESDTFWDQVNFPHLSDVFSNVDLTHEMYQEPVINIKSTEFKIENSESNFTSVNLGIQSYITTAYTKTRNILIISFGILLILLIFFIIFKSRNVCKRINISYRRNSRNERTNNPNRTEIIDSIARVNQTRQNNTNDILTTAEILKRYNYI